MKYFKIEWQKQTHDTNIKNWLCKFTTVYQTVHLEGYILWYLNYTSMKQFFFKKENEYMVYGKGLEQ